MTVRNLPMCGALPQPMLLLTLLPMCQVWMLRLLRRFWPPLQLPLLAGHLKLICTIAKIVSASEVLRDSSIFSTPQLFSSSADTARSDKTAPSGSDDVVDHEACGLSRSKVNDDNDTSSRSKSETGALDQGAGDATQPSCDGIDSNDTASSDVVNVIGVEMDPVDISNINKNIDNSVNDSSDNNVSVHVIVVDSGFVPPSGVSNIIYSIEDGASNVSVM